MEQKEINYSRVIDMMLKYSDVKEDAGDNLSYMYPNLEKLAKWYVQCDQERKPDAETGVLECLRIVRIKKGIPKYALNAMKADKADDACENARVFLSGMYMVVKCLIVSRDKLYGDMNIGSLKRPLFKLPDEFSSTYQESSLRENNNNTYIFLAKSSLTDFIWLGNHYKMLEVSDF